MSVRIRYSLLAAAIALAPAPLLAQAATPPTIEACYVPASGTIYRIKVPNAPAACLSPVHVPFAWNLQGPQGPQGAQGPAGPAAALDVRRHTSSLFTIPAAGGVNAAYACPSGRVVSGGLELVDESTAARRQVRINESFPRSSTAWEIGAQNAGSSPVQARVQLICL